MSRADWRVLLSWHIAESREQARREAGPGLMRWHNEYNVGTLQRPGLQPFTSPEDAVEKTAGGEGAASTIGTPDDLVKTIKSLMQVSGGVGTIVGFVHDWANPENTRRSWDMVARYVIAQAAAAPAWPPARTPGRARGHPAGCQASIRSEHGRSSRSAHVAPAERSSRC